MIGRCSLCFRRKQSGIGFHKLCYRCRAKQRYKNPEYREKAIENAKKNYEKLRQEGKLKEKFARDNENARKRKLKSVFLKEEEDEELTEVKYTPDGWRII